LPRWSPDGKQILFMGRTANTGWRAFVISSAGGAPRDLVPSAPVAYDPNWSPDGKAVVLTLNEAGSPGALPSGPGIAIFDLTNEKLSALPGAAQLFSPRWSPDGRYIAAITDDSEKLRLFDRTTKQWNDLVNMPIGYPSWSHDGQYLYFDTTLTDDPAFFRVRIADHRVERLVSLKDLQRYWGDFGPWTGLAPDDSLLVVRDIGSQDIYALDWKAP
jgi:Tol biopolymer transport system component